jgi:ABC-2 type transport system permease protein
VSLRRVYPALFVAQFQAMSQYRAQAFLYVLFSVMRPIVFLAAWAAVATSRGGSVGGFDVGTFAAYFIALTLVNHIGVSWFGWEFEQQVAQGTLSSRLLRPLHPIHYAVAENIVYKITTSVGLLPVLVLVAVTFGARFETRPEHALLFVPSALLAGALNFLFDWLIATSAFWITRAHQVAFIVSRVGFIFGGQIAPLALLPGPLETIAYALPFGYMLGVPADILRGGMDVGRALTLVGVQALWVAATFLTLRVAWRAGVRRYGAVGG